MNLVSFVSFRYTKYCVFTVLIHFVSAVMLSVKTVFILLFIVYLFIFNIPYLIKMLWPWNFPVLWWAFYSFSFVLARNLYDQFSFQIQNFLLPAIYLQWAPSIFLMLHGEFSFPRFDFITEWSRSVLLRQPLAPEGSFSCHWVPKAGLAFRDTLFSSRWFSVWRTAEGFGNHGSRTLSKKQGYFQTVHLTKKKKKSELLSEVL